MASIKTKMGKEKNEVLLHEGDGFMSTEQLTKCKNAVCMIRYETRCSNSGKRILKRGSGFYAKAKIFGVEYCCIVTNNHVVSCPEDALIATAVFHYERENQGITVQLKPNKIFHTNKELDYSIIGVDEEQLSRANPQIFPIEYSEQPQATVGDDIFIFQHPMGMPKQFSYEKIIHIQSPFVYYVADTSEGSSGSPVLWKLQLMAVHKVGSEKDQYNKGTLFSEIINDLHTGYNFNNPNNISSKRDFNCVSRNSPREMEENLSKKVCIENYNNEKSCELSKGANILDETQSPDDDLLDKLSQECCSFYKKLARQLHVKHEKIEEISRDNINYGSLAEKSYQVLHEWKESNSKPFTNQVLEKALRSLDKNATANKYFGKK